MSISNRIHDTVEQWQAEWKDRLKGWLVGCLSIGVEAFFDILGKAAAPKLKPLIDSLEATGQIPPELKPLIDELKDPKGEVAALFANSIGGSMIGGAIGRMGDALFGNIAHMMNRAHPTVPPSMAQAISLRLRDKIDDATLKDILLILGFPEDSHKWYMDLAEARLDPMSVITAWRRDSAKYEKLFDDLRHQGWTNDRIEALKFFTLYYPSPAELVHWTAREVFEPNKIEKYGLMDSIDKLRRDDFYKAGMNDEQIDNHWIAHWEHASFLQVIEMLHRKIITEQDVKDWFPLVEIAPYWAENLIKVAYTWPSRVDVRRWYDMRTIDDARLKELYEGMGYRDKNLEDYITWTKVYVDFPSLVARWQKGWITEQDVRSQLAVMGMPEDRIETMIQEKIKPEAPARIEDAKELTKAEIYKGVKVDYISWQDGIELLMDLGYEDWEAEFILSINVGALEGSPETYAEFKDITQKYRRAIGLQADIPPMEIQETGHATKQAKLALQEAEQQGKSEAELAPLRKALSDKEYHYRALLVAWEQSKNK